MNNDFSVFRTSLHPSIYNNTISPYTNINKNIIRTAGIIHPSLCKNKSCDNIYNGYNFVENVNPIIYKKYYNIYDQDRLYTSPSIINTIKQNILKDKKITFNKEIYIITIHDKEYYKHNNLKNDIWWTSKELEYMRTLFMNEVARYHRMNPGLTISQCIKELCKYGY